MGTSGMKLVLIGEDETILRHQSVTYEATHLREGWSEIDPELWYEAMRTGMQRLLDGFDSSRLAGIAITGQMHTLVVLDGQGRPLRPALMWNDLRTKEMIGELRAFLKNIPDDGYLQRTISTGSPLSNLWWLKKEEPETFLQIQKILIGPDYLVYRLTGTFGTDFCEASTSCLYDLDGRCWSEQIRSFLGLPKEAFPPVRGSAVQAGNLLPAQAEILGLSSDVKVFVGTGDNAATALSTGCLGREEPFISLGTSGVVVVPTHKQTAFGKRILFSLDGEEFSNLLQGTLQSNGNTVHWWTCQIVKEEDYGFLDRTIDLERAKENEIIFYPHLGGEKTLYADPSLRGAFLGLGIDTQTSDLSYSLIEGICFALRELCEKLGLSLKDERQIKVVGGGSNSHVWMQILANVLNTPVARLDGMVGASFGMALMAKESCLAKAPARLSTLTNSSIQVAQVFFPDPVLAEHCNAKYQRYLRIYEGLQIIKEGPKE